MTQIYNPINKAIQIHIADGGNIITGVEVETALQENRTAIDLNTAHVSADGSSHTFIDQDVTIGSGPAFTSAALTTPAIGAATGTSLTNSAALTLASTAAGVNINTHTDATDDFTVNTSMLVVEGDTGNVGIGTTGPEGKLHVMIGDNSGAAANGTYDAIALEGNAATYFNFMTPANKRGGFIFSDGTRAAGGFVYTHSDPIYGAGTEDSFVFSPGGFSVPKVIFTGTGNVGIGTTSPTNLLSLGGESARIFWMERELTADTAGNTLTITAGGATSGATNKAGGDLILQGGLSTGSAESGVTIQGCVAGASGTADRTQTTAIEVTSNKIGFWAVTPVVRPTALTTQLTTITHTAPGTPDYALQNLTQTTPFGFVTADEGNTALSTIANLQARVAELETKFQGLGLLT